jgi:hypothetical protein
MASRPDLRNSSFLHWTTESVTARCLGHSVGRRIHRGHVRLFKLDERPILGSGVAQVDKTLDTAEVLAASVTDGQKAKAFELAYLCAWSR